MAEDDDIREVMKAEGSRGRRPIDIEARRERNELLKILRELLKEGDEEGLRVAMHAYGLTDESPEFLRALKVWRAKPKT